MEPRWRCSGRRAAFPARPVGHRVPSPARSSAAPSPPVRRPVPAVGARGTRAAQRPFLLRHAVLSALSWAAAGASAAPPPTHSPRSFPVRAVRRIVRRDLSTGGQLPGPGGGARWGCPSPSCLLPRSAPGPRCRVSAHPRGTREPGEAAPCTDTRPGASPGDAGPPVPSGPGGRADCAPLPRAPPGSAVVDWRRGELARGGGGSVRRRGVVSPFPGRAHWPDGAVAGRGQRPRGLRPAPIETYRRVTRAQRNPRRRCQHPAAAVGAGFPQGRPGARGCAGGERAMQYQPAGAAPAALGVGVPLYAPTPLLQPAHPTPFYIEDILGRGPAAAPAPHSMPAPPPPTLPSPNSSFTSLVSPYRTPIYEPTPVHPAFSHHLAATYGTGAYAGPLYSFPRAVGDYAHALIRQDPLGKPCALPAAALLASRPHPAVGAGVNGKRPKAVPFPPAPPLLWVPPAPSGPRLIYSKLKTCRAQGLSARPQCAAAVTQICFPSNQVTLRVSLVMSRVVLVGSFNCAWGSHGRSQSFPADDLKNSREAGSARWGPRGSSAGRVGPGRAGLGSPAPTWCPWPGEATPVRGPSPVPRLQHLFLVIAKLDLTHHICAVKEADPFRSYRKP